MNKYLPHLAILLFAVGLHGGGYLSRVESQLIDSRFGLVRLPASGDVVVVEIDSASLRSLDSWPWPRDYHARLVDRLVAADARTIAFDIDFSARSMETSDQAFAAALERSEGRVILPVFQQRASSAEGSNGVVNRPIEPLRAHVRLAVASFRSDASGKVREAALSQDVDGVRMPTMAAALAGLVLPPAESFLIDFGIRRSTIPTLSYKDVLAGDFAPEAVRGKVVIVGAGALELGSRLATPLEPSTSSPMLQALAYESLIQDRALRQTGLPLAIALTVVLALVAGPWLAGLHWIRGATAALAGAAGLYVLAVALQGWAGVVIEIAPWLLAITGCFAIGMMTQIEAYSRTAFRRRMEVEQSRAVIRSVISDSLDGIVIVDWRGRVHLINHAAVALLGVDAETVVGSPAAGALVPLALPAAATGEPFLETIDRLAVRQAPVAKQLKTADGKLRDIEVVVRRTVASRGTGQAERRSADRTFFTLSLRDVSAHRAAERAQRQAAELAVEANEAKSLFLANMSHELRTPLNAILGFSELMTREMFGPMVPSRYRDYAEDIHASSRHLLSVLDDILDLAKVESGRQEVVPKPFALDEVFEECLRIVRGRNLHLRRVFEIDLPPQSVVVRADRRLILQSVLNLVTNAVKFSDADTRIVLRGWREDIGRTVIEVVDSGWGISAEDLRSVARPFYQAQAAKAADGAGTGLGLSLVARYVELHGGTMQIESELGRGTTVRLVLPASLVEVKKRQAAAGEDTR